jgi:hypothetical protein
LSCSSARTAIFFDGWRVFLQANINELPVLYSVASLLAAINHFIGGLFLVPLDLEQQFN